MYLLKIPVQCVSLVYPSQRPVNMTWLTVSLALALALTSPAQASPCPSGWVDATYVDLGCLKFHDRGNNFEEAAIYCQNYQVGR